MNDDLASFFQLTVEHKDFLNVFQALGQEHCAPAGNQGLIVEHAGPPATEFRLPGGPFGGLQPVLAVHLH